MKRFFYILSAAFAVMSCSGNLDDADDTGKIPDEYLNKYAEPFTLVVDKSEVEADGDAVVTFTLTDAYDRDMTEDKKALESINIVSEEGLRVARMSNTLAFIANGKYTFSATYKGRKSENTVEVEAKNRGKYEKYHKNVAIYKATATWCAPCAVMTRALLGLNDDAKEHSVELCWHYDDDLAITSPGSAYDCGAMIVSYFGGSGVPTVVLDLQDMVIEKSSSALESAIWNLRAEYPATCGIKLATEYDAAEDMIDIRAELTSATGGSYDIGFAVLLNDQVIPSGTNDGGKYSHIVRASTGNYLMYSNSMSEVSKDASMFRTEHVGAGGLDPENLSVVAFALVKHGDGARIDNIVEVKVGETLDYIYNE